MKRVLCIICFMILCFSVSSAWTADKVVVIPLLGGTVGNASVADVVKGKTFSSSVAGKGATGTLEYTEFCDGKEAGAEAFKLDTTVILSLYVGDVYTTDTGKLVEMVGINDNACQSWSAVTYHQDTSFLIAPAVLPHPCYGVKGTFYHLHDGEIVFTNFF